MDGGRTVRDAIAEGRIRGPNGAVAEELGIDPETDLDRHVLVAVPKCSTCRGSGREGLMFCSPDCADCDGRGWVLP